VIARFDALVVGYGDDMGSQHDLEGQVRHRSLQPAPISSRIAREFVRQVCREWGMGEDVCDEAALVATELVANVVDHAGTRCVITVSRDDSRLRIEVEDFYPCPVPTSLHVDPTAPRGRGLLVVAGLSTEWGVRDLPNGKTVWAVLGSV
jgi:anti-sigma regulatory factor (Ser/Thr protein kinase)